MALGQMRQTVFQDSNHSLFQSSVNDQFTAIAKIPIIQGVLIADQALVAAQTNTIDHKLGRTASGYLIVSTSAGALIWNDTFSGNSSIVLHCSANCTVSLWVF